MGMHWMYHMRLPSSLMPQVALGGDDALLTAILVPHAETSAHG